MGVGIKLELIDMLINQSYRGALFDVGGVDTRQNNSIGIMKIRSKVGNGKTGIDWGNEVGFFQVIVLNQRFRPHPSLLIFIPIPPVQTPHDFESSTVDFLENSGCRRPFQTYLNIMVWEF